MTHPWRAGTRALAAAMVVLAQHGCVPPPVVHEVTFERLSTPDAMPLVGQPAAIERLLVVADVDPQTFPEPMFDGLHDALTNRLAACGVRPSALYLDPADLGSQDRIAAELGRSHPNAVIMVRGAGSRVIGTRLITGDYAFKGTMWFDLTVLETRSQAPIWRARAKVDVTVGGWSVSAESGAQFATGVVSRLRDDGVLVGCPPREQAWPTITPPPGCLQQRQRVFRAAADAWDNDLRVAKLREAPTCDTAPGSR